MEKVVQEVSEGSSISEVRRCYGIRGGDTVQKWIKKYGREELLNTVIHIKMRGETDQLKKLESENKKLKIALADAILEKDVLETLIEVVDEHCQTDVKKKNRTGVINRCSEDKKQKVNDMCKYFRYTRAAYYKSLEQERKKDLFTFLC